MAKLPSFQFYPGDWLKDPALRLCSPQARALWIDMLCLMWEIENRGILRTNGIIWTEKDVEKTTGIDRKFLQELIQKGVCAKAPRSGVLFSKRMVRDELKRARLARNGQKGGKSPKQTGSKPEANPEANGEQTPKQIGGSSFSSSSSPSGKEEMDAYASLSGAPAPDRPEEVLPNGALPDGGGVREEPPPFITLPTNRTGLEYPVSRHQVAEFAVLYPAVDVEQAFRNMRGWLQSNPQRRKTIRGMPAFMNGWLSREQNNPKPKPQLNGHGTPRDRNYCPTPESDAERRRILGLT